MIVMNNDTSPKFKVSLRQLALALEHSLKYATSAQINVAEEGIERCQMLVEKARVACQRRKVAHEAFEAFLRTQGQ
jgi:hypothetical protein